MGNGRQEAGHTDEDKHVGIVADQVQRMRHECAEGCTRTQRSREYPSCSTRREGRDQTIHADERHVPFDLFVVGKQVTVEQVLPGSHRIRSNRENEKATKNAPPNTINNSVVLPRRLRITFMIRRITEHMTLRSSRSRSPRV